MRYDIIVLNLCLCLGILMVDAVLVGCAWYLSSIYSGFTMGVWLCVGFTIILYTIITAGHIFETSKKLETKYRIRRSRSRQHV